MNLVKEILNQFSGGTLGKLSSLLGADEETTGYATNAAVPTLLAALSSVASSGSGLSKLTSALKGTGMSGLDQAVGLLNNDPQDLASRGTHMLSSVFGDNLLSSVVSMLGKKVNLGGDTVRRLLSYLAPIVIGKVVSSWQSKGGTPQALTNLFAEQQSHIVDALPAGISTSDIPGWSALRNAPEEYRTAERRTADVAPAPKSAASLLVPLLLGALGLFVLWNFIKPRDRDAAQVDRTETVTEEVIVQKPVIETEPAAPVDTPAIPIDRTAVQLTDDLRGIYTNIDETLAGITDAASAQAAVPKLEELSREIDTIKELISKLPESGVATVRDMADRQMTGLQEQADKVLNTPSLSAEIKSLINAILRKLTELFAAPTP